MQSETSLKALIQRLMPRQPELISGTVISENPIRIRAENDDKLVACKALVIPERLKLKTGDSVHLLALNGGKKYYALDKAVK